MSASEMHVKDFRVHFVILMHPTKLQTCSTTTADSS